jgi:hypothetical protein
MVKKLKNRMVVSVIEATLFSIIKKYCVKTAAQATIAMHMEKVVFISNDQIGLMSTIYRNSTESYATSQK